MSDKTEAASRPDAGQSADAAPVAQGSEEKPVTPPQAPVGQQEATPQYITREEAEKLKQDILNDARSYSDKGRVKLQKAMADVEQAVATMRGLGREISDEDVRKMRTEAASKAMATAEDDTAQDPAAPRVTLQYDQNEYLAEGFRLEGKHGVTVEQGDPEMSMIKITGNKGTDLKNLQDAFAAKAKRMSQTSTTETNQETPATGSAARVPLKPGTEPVVKLSPTQKLSKGLKNATFNSAPPDKK